ncbi:hypothetical protein [Serinicoccus marinus]|uniref:hypothetical protein n=1 Tax=Serinicoccus marinus TaxID=247333 RepID=UPI00122E2CA5|nr:hypothetical protein [Serinicoccus marinus]
MGNRNGHAEGTPGAARRFKAWSLSSATALGLASIVGAGAALPAVASPNSTATNTSTETERTEAEKPQSTTIKVAEGASGSQVVVLDSARSKISRKLNIPDGHRLIPGREDGGYTLLSGDGESVATIAAGDAYLDDGSQLNSSTELRGNHLVQTFDVQAEVSERIYVFAPVERTGVHASADEESNSDIIELLESDKTGPDFQQMAVITVPSRYVYDLSHPQKGLHDWCPKSPDGYYNGVKTVYYWGPCARHDLAYDDANRRVLWADDLLGDHVATNCKHYLASWDWNRYACIQQGTAMEAVVTGLTYYELV